MIHLAEFRRVMRELVTAVTVVTSKLEEEPVGMTANAVTSASLDPPLLAFFVSPTSTTYAGIRHSGAFAVNVLAGDQAGTARAFSGRGDEKFDGLVWKTAKTGAPILGDCVAWLDCRVYDRHPAGDHHMVLGVVQDATTGAGDPLVFHRGDYVGTDTRQEAVGNA